MPEGIAAIIYGALLSSRSSPETCLSSRSAVKVILDGMRTGPGSVSGNKPLPPGGNYRYLRKFDNNNNNAACLRFQNSLLWRTGFVLGRHYVEERDIKSGPRLTSFTHRPNTSLRSHHQLTRRVSMSPPGHSSTRGVNLGARQTAKRPSLEQENDDSPTLSSSHFETLHPTVIRLRECVHNPPSNVRDVLQVWYDLEQQNPDDPAARWLTMASVNHYFLIRFAKLLVRLSCSSWNEPCPCPEEIANVIDAVLLEIQKRASRPRGVETYFLWHANILRKEYSSVVQGLSAAILDSKESDAKQLRVLTELFLNCYHNDGLAASLDLLLPFQKLVLSHLDSREDRFTSLLQIEHQRLCNSLVGAFSTIQDPLVWITTVLGSNAAQELAMCIFFHTYGKRGDADRAWRLFEFLQARKIIVPYIMHLRLLRVFIAQRAFQCAEGINVSLQTHYKELATDPNKRLVDEIYLNLRLAAIQGDFAKAQELYDILSSRKPVLDGGVRRLLLHAYGAGENAERVEELFAQFFTSTGNPPTVRDYREVIYAHVRVKDMTAVNRWLEEMVNKKVLPNLSIYNMILTVLSHHLDAEAALSLLSTMYQQNIKPDKYSFTTILSTFAAKRDPVSAERIYERAIKEGIEPDEVMTMALMNAHIEAGSWRGAIRVFDYLNVGRIRNSRYLGQLYNALLKAYVLIGAPFNVVLKIFRRFEKAKLLPTLRSYTLLIQSACDSGRMDIARDLFLELDAQPAYGRLKSHVDAYLMTIIMAGFLRTGDRERAKLVYEDMLSRELHPGAVAFGIIIRSFADRGTAESLKIAEEFMHGVLDMDEPRKALLHELRGSPHKALESLFAPLMTIYGRDQLDVEGVRRLHDYMISLGGEPTMISLNILMDAYRRTGNITAVQNLWPDVVATAKRLTQRDLLDHFPVFRIPTDDNVRPIERTPEVPSFQANTLCISLSIYIEALSQAGKHLEVPRVWKEVRDLGFAFDAHNWNHLAVALMRAGEVERAFDIVERVLLPYQKKAADIVRERKKNPSSPFFFIKDPRLRQTVEGSGVDQDTTTCSLLVSPQPGVFQPPEVVTQDDEDEDRRQQSIGSASKSRRIESVKTSTRQQRKFKLTDLNLDEPDLDVAQPLYELQQMSAHFQGWRVHTRTLEALRQALRFLSFGKLVRASRDRRRFTSDGDDTVDIAERLIQERMTSDRSNIGDREEAEKVLAMELTRRIAMRYPKAVMWTEHFFGRHEPKVRRKRK